MRLKHFFLALLASMLIVLFVGNFSERILACCSFAVNIVSQRQNVISSSEPCVPSEGRNESNGMLYEFNGPDFRLFVYSAFYDDRLSLRSSPVVRIIAIADKLFESKIRNDTDPDIACILSDSVKTKRVKFDRDPLRCGPDYPLGLFGEYAYPYVLTCPSDGIVPKYLSINSGIFSKMASSCVPVEFPQKPKRRIKFSVCVPVSYGRLDPIHLIEWVEMQRIMGVEHISVYDSYLSKNARRVFSFYSRNERVFLDFRKLDLIHLSDLTSHILELAVSLNDCLYRNLHSAERVIVSDFDEFVKPQKHRNLSEMINYLDSGSVNRSIQYITRNCYYFLESEADNVLVSPYLMFLKYRWKAPVSPEFHRFKPIILTDACTHLYSHECLGRTAGYAEYQMQKYVNPSVALNQHYRKCPLTPTECKDALENSTHDDAMLKFKNILTSKVKDRIPAILGTAPGDF